MAAEEIRIVTQPRAMMAFLRMALLAGFLALLLLVGVSVLAVGHYLPAEIYLRNLALVQLMQRQVESFQVQKIQELQQLRALLANNPDSASSKILQLFLIPQGPFESFFWADSQGVVLGGVQTNGLEKPLRGYDISGFSYYRAMRAGDSVHWSPVFLSPFSDAPTTTLTIPLEDSRLLTAQISLERLRLVVDELNLGGRSHMILLDPRGAYIYHPEHHRVQEREVFPYFLQIMLDSNGLWHLEKMFWRGEEYRMMGRKLEASGWSVAMMQSSREQMQPVRTLLKTMAITDLLLLGGLVWFVLVAHRRFFEPVQILLRVMENAARGIYPDKIPRQRYREFQQLANGLLGMVSSISQREEQLLNLNRQLQNEIADNARADSAFQAIMLATSKSTGEELFSSLVVSLVRWLKADLAMVASVQGKDLCVQSVYGFPEIEQKMLFAIAETPCERTLANSFFHQTRDLQKIFPKSDFLAKLQFDSYVGIALLDAQGSPVGVLAAFSRGEMTLPERTREVMPILALRLAAEMARSEAQSALLRMNNNLQEITGSLSSKNKELESMVYVASHDLRAPLVNISGFSKELRLMVDQITDWGLQLKNMPPNIRELLQIEIPECLRFISGSVQRMDQLLAGLLRLARVGRGDGNTELLTQLSPIIERIVEDLDYSLRQCQGEVEVGILPCVRGSEDDLLQVFSNLLSNAVKYRQEGVPLRIQVGSKTEDNSVYLYIQDNGKGISARHLGRIFDVFYRGDADASVSGEGLGLSIVQKIVERLGGEIRLQSRVGEGTRVELRLRT